MSGGVGWICGTLLELWVLLAFAQSLFYKGIVTCCIMSREVEWNYTLDIFVI
jgi:hypothetical protein